ncbi:hypothetical protein VPH35_001638 [Triticum aestivum]
MPPHARFPPRSAERHHRLRPPQASLDPPAMPYDSTVSSAVKSLFSPCSIPLPNAHPVEHRASAAAMGDEHHAPEPPSARTRCANTFMGLCRGRLCRLFGQLPREACFC